jgi:hypothetical protein
MLAGCGSRRIQNEGAVRQGIMDYLSQRKDLNLSSMQVEVTSVSFRQDEADVTVAFLPKGSTGGGMQMRYTLERQGSQWVVKGKGRSEAGQSPHGQMPGGQMPGGMGAAPGGEKQGGAALPPGHPAVGNPPGAK